MNRFAVQVAQHSRLWLMLLALSSAAQEQPRGLYDGAAIRFERAQFIKPCENPDLALIFTLAPLVLQEVRDTNTLIVPARIFFQPGVVRLQGQDLVQMTYWWTYERDDAELTFGRRGKGQRSPTFKGGSAGLMKAPAPSCSSSAGLEGFELRSAQGIRLTLDTNGSPVIYEVLGQTGGVRQIYVTQSVEAAARAGFGPELSGRRHAIERSLSEAPGMVVPRVIDDPPAVMGPIVYLSAGTHEVATLICRCMAAQARTLVGSGYYTLTPSNAPPALVSRPGRLEESLRLPMAAPTGTNPAH